VPKRELSVLGARRPACAQTDHHHPPSLIPQRHLVQNRDPWEIEPVVEDTVARPAFARLFEDEGGCGSPLCTESGQWVTRIGL